MHFEAKFGELSADDGGADLQFLTGRKCKCSVVYIEHAEDVEEGTFREGIPLMTGNASRLERGVIVSAELEGGEVVADPFLF